MISFKFLPAFAVLALLSGVEAGVCYPKGSSTLSATVEPSTTVSATASTSTAETSFSATETTFTTASTTFSTTLSTTFSATASTTAWTDSITISSSTTSAEPEETLCLRNGAFDETYNVSPWYSALNVAPLFMGVVSGMSHEGDHSLRLKFNDRPLYFLANPLNSKRLVAEQDYEISAWVRFDKELNNGEGCEQVFIWCMYDEWNWAEKAGDGQLLASADSVNDFAQVKATCRWSQEQVDNNPLVMLRFTCSKTLAWVDSITMEKAGQ